MQNFIKIYPKTMSVNMVREVLAVKLVYTVEQYGMLTGPFEVVVKFHPEMLATGIDPWEIISNTRPKYNSLFEHFFTTMEKYLRAHLGIQPIEEVRTGAKKSFEMYFPDIHYDYNSLSFEETRSKKFKSKYD